MSAASTPAREEALENNKPLLIDVGTDNCHWCKQLDATTFRDPAIAALVNERYVPLKVYGQNRRHWSKRCAPPGPPAP